MTSNLYSFFCFKLFFKYMGSVCFKVEKENSASIPEQKSAKPVLKSSQESRPLFKNKVLSVKKTFLVSKTEGSKPKVEGCVRPFTQLEAQVSQVLSSNKFHCSQVAEQAEESSPKSGCSIPEESCDSWTQNGAPLRELKVSYGAVPIFKLDKAVQPLTLGQLPTLQQHKTACKSPLDSQVRTRADSFASTVNSSKTQCMDISKVFEVDSGDFSPKRLTRKESAKVTQVRRELMRLAITY